MNPNTDNSGRLPTVPSLHPPPYCGLLSAFLGVLAVLGVLVIFAASWSFRDHTSTRVIWVATGTLAGFCVAGFVLGGIALVRSERFWGLAAFGMILNAPLPVALLYSRLANLAPDRLLILLGVPDHGRMLWLFTTLAALTGGLLLAAPGPMLRLVHWRPWQQGAAPIPAHPEPRLAGARAAGAVLLAVAVATALLLATGWI